MNKKNNNNNIYKNRNSNNNNNKSWFFFFFIAKTWFGSSNTAWARQDWSSSSGLRKHKHRAGTPRFHFLVTVEEILALILPNGETTKRKK